MGRASNTCHWRDDVSRSTTNIHTHRNVMIVGHGPLKGQAFAIRDARRANGDAFSNPAGLVPLNRVSADLSDGTRDWQVVVRHKSHSTRSPRTNPPPTRNFGSPSAPSVWRASKRAVTANCLSTRYGHTEHSDGDETTSLGSPRIRRSLRRSVERLGQTGALASCSAHSDRVSRRQASCL